MIHIPTHVSPLPPELNSAIRSEYERSLTPKEKDAKAAAVDHLIDIGDPNNSMRAYLQTVPGIVRAVLAKRFEGTPFPWAVAASPGVAEAETGSDTGGWFEPVLASTTAVPARVVIDPDAVDEFFRGLT